MEKAATPTNVKGKSVMLAGLRDLDLSEVEAFAKETQVYTKDTSKEDLLEKLLAWMAGRVDAKGKSPQEIERAVLAWLGERLDLSFSADASVNDIEASVRRKIAEESYEFLFPFLAVGSAVAYLGPARVVGPKLELIEASSAALIPSHSARERMRLYWKERGDVLLQQEGQMTPEALVGYFEETLAYLSQTGLQTRISILMLNHVVALSDGRYEAPEEAFMQRLAEALQIDPAEAARVRQEVSETFWRQQTALGGGTYREKDTGTDQELSLNMQAAQLTLEATGGLASFSQEVEQGFVASLHRSLQKDSAFRRGLRQGGALGFATGMLCYIKERWRVGDHEILMRLGIAAIFRQHLEATGDNARITTERIGGYVQDRKVENVADTLAETAVGTKEPEPKEVRRISLEPKIYPELQ